MNTTQRFVAIALAAGLLAGMGHPASAKVKFTLATSNGAKEHSAVAMERWAAAMKTATKGDLEMTVLAGGSLGGDNQLLQQLKTNEIQLNIAGPVVIHNFLREYQCMEAEYVYANGEHGLKVWNGKLGKEVNDLLVKNHGIRIVGVAHRGARQLTSNKAVRVPEDMKGIKVRVTNPLREAIFKAAGALPGPLPISELYGALRSGVYEAQENPITTIYGSKYFEVQKYVNLTAHVWSYLVTTVNEGFYQSLSPEHRKVFDETFRDAAAWLNKAVLDSEEDLLAKMKAAGVEIVQPDVAAFQKLATPIVEEFAAKNCRAGILADIAAAK